MHLGTKINSIHHQEVREKKVCVGPPHQCYSLGIGLTGQRYESTYMKVSQKDDRTK
jgi:hypothetical protein